MSTPSALLQTKINELYIQKLFEPCMTKAALKSWLKLYLSVELTETTIDENSTSNALEMVWSVYSAMLTGDENRTQHVVAVARGGAKTLGAVVIEILAMLHFGRNIVHCAAEEQQSHAALKFFDERISDNAILKSFVTKSNSRTREFSNMPRTAHRNKTSASLMVVIATLEGVNSKRASLIVCDELDLVNPVIVEELTYIQIPHEGKPAISLFLSSRQSNSGPIQRKVDQAANPASLITLHMWSLVDLMKKCDESRYLPESQKGKRYINNYTLAVLAEDDYSLLKDAAKTEYSEYELHSGCIHCPIVSVCRGRAIKQTSENKYLRSFTDVRNLLAGVSTPSSILARMLNLRPESNGLIYNSFDRRKHFRPIEEVWEFCFGEPPEGEKSKVDLVEKLRESDWRILCGVDFGYNDPATAVLLGYDKSSGKLAVIHVENAIGYDNDTWLEYVREKVFDVYGFDNIRPDLAYTVAIKKARSFGMPCSEFKKPKVETGISFVRSKLFNPITQTTSFMIVADSGTEFMVKEFESWSYMKTSTGYLYGQYDKDGPNHSLDALRYAVVQFSDIKGVGVSKIHTKQPPEFYNKVAISPEDLADKKAIDEHFSQFMDNKRPSVLDKKEEGRKKPFMFLF